MSNTHLINPNPITINKTEEFGQIVAKVIDSAVVQNDMHRLMYISVENTVHNLNDFKVNAMFNHGGGWAPNIVISEILSFKLSIKEMKELKKKQFYPVNSFTKEALARFIL